MRLPLPRPAAIAAAIVLVVPAARAQSSADSSRRPAERSIILSGQLAFLTGMSAPAFLGATRQTMYASWTEMPSAVSLGGTLRIAITNGVAAIATVQYIRVDAASSSGSTILDSTTGKSAFVGSGEQLAIDAIPGMLGIEWTPIDAQFHSYLLAAAGVIVGHVFWDHSASVPSSLALSLPSSSRFDDIVAGPALMIGAGLELRFDEFQSGSLFRGLTLEGRYRYSPLRADYFGPASAMVSRPPDAWRSRYTFRPDGVEILVGVNLQFHSHG